MVSLKMAILCLKRVFRLRQSRGNGHQKTRVLEENKQNMLFAVAAETPEAESSPVDCAKKPRPRLNGLERNSSDFRGFGAHQSSLVSGEQSLICNKSCTH